MTTPIDPHQAAEAAAFSLMPSTGAAQVDTTADMFGYDADDLQHWQASRCAPHLRPSRALGFFLPAFRPSARSLWPISLRRFCAFTAGSVSRWYQVSPL